MHQFGILSSLTYCNFFHLPSIFATIIGKKWPFSFKNFVCLCSLRKSRHFPICLHPYSVSSCLFVPSLVFLLCSKHIPVMAVKTQAGGSQPCSDVSCKAGADKGWCCCPLPFGNLGLLFSWFLVPCLFPRLLSLQPFLKIWCNSELYLGSLKRCSYC